MNNLNLKSYRDTTTSRKMRMLLKELLNRKASKMLNYNGSVLNWVAALVVNHDLVNIKMVLADCISKTG